LWMKVRNVLIVFLISGFWHGANWTFIAWGLLNAIYIMPLILLNTNRNNLDIVAQGKSLPTMRELFSMIVTFGLTVFAWIFFRAKSIHHAFGYIARIFSRSLLSRPEFVPVALIALIIIFIIIEWLGREQQYAIARLGFKWPKPMRWAFYYVIILVITRFSGTQQPFIYFQF
jgi:alginate O-acetyltransferase complex protein AlgI